MLTNSCSGMNGEQVHVCTPVHICTPAFLLSHPLSLSVFLAAHKPPPMYGCVARVTTWFAVPIKRQRGWKGEAKGSPV